MGEIRSRCCLKKSDREQISYDKRATGAIRSFSEANRSFTHKKTSVLQKKKIHERIPNPAVHYTVVKLATL